MARFFTQGSSNKINLGNSATLNPANNYTVSCWFNWGGGTVDASNEAWCFTRDDNTLGRAFALGITQIASVKQVCLQVNGAFNVAAGTTPSTNTWHHLAATVSASGVTYTLYFDGAQNAQATSQANTNSTTGNSEIGARTYASFEGFFDGSIADVAIWNTALSGANIAALAAGARPVDVNSANLQGWWPLGGYQSPEPDISGNGNNGTLTGTAQAAMPPQLGRGARNFVHANTQFIDITGQSLSGLGITGAYTVSLWVYPNGVNTSFFIAGDDDTLDGGGAIEMAFATATPNFWCRVTNTTPTRVTVTAGTPNIGVWNHMAVTYDGATVTLYGNGVSVATGAQTGNVRSTGNDFMIGCRGGSGGIIGGTNYCWDGNIADVAIWNTALTSGNITSLFNGVRPTNVNSANLKGWWPLGGSSNSTETDLSSGAHNGTLTGGTGTPLPILGPPALWRISG